MTPEQMIDLAKKVLIAYFDFDDEEATKFAELLKIVAGGG